MAGPILEKEELGKEELSDQINWYSDCSLNKISTKMLIQQNTETLGASSPELENPYKFLKKHITKFQIHRSWLIVTYVHLYVDI